MYQYTAVSEMKDTSQTASAIKARLLVLNPTTNQRVVVNISGDQL